jgi:hypothetical protein
MRLLFAALLIAAPAFAEQSVSPDEFREYAEGWTLYFERDGLHFGSEEFRSDGMVRWRYSDGSCVRGAWRPHDGQLCFLYDTEDEGAVINCWRMMRDEQGLFARLLDGENAGLELRVTRRDRAPLLCGEPGRST